MPELLCSVTVTDAAGVSHTLEIKAKSVNWAACGFFAEIRSNPATPRINFQDETTYEVRLAGSAEVYRVQHRKMLTWGEPGSGESSSAVEVLGPGRTVPFPATI